MENKRYALHYDFRCWKCGIYLYTAVHDNPLRGYRYWTQPSYYTESLVVSCSPSEIQDVAPIEARWFTDIGVCSEVTEHKSILRNGCGRVYIHKDIPIRSIRVQKNMFKGHTTEDEDLKECVRELLECNYGTYYSKRLEHGTHDDKLDYLGKQRD